MKILISSEAKNKAFNQITESFSRQGYNLLEDRKPISEENSKKDLAKLESNIKNSEVIIIDVSTQDFKTGYIISRALTDKKVVIALRSEKSKDSKEPLLFANKSKNLLIFSYTDKNAVEVAENALSEAKKRLDTKFILIIPPEIDRYLDWASQNKRLHKAQIVRSAVEGSMKKDKDYKDYLGTTK